MTTSSKPYGTPAPASSPGAIERSETALETAHAVEPVNPAESSALWVHQCVSSATSSTHRAIDRKVRFEAAGLHFVAQRVQQWTDDQHQLHNEVVCEARVRVFERFEGYVTLLTSVGPDGRQSHQCLCHVDLQSVAGAGDADLDLVGREDCPTEALAVGSIRATLQALRWAIAPDRRKLPKDCPVLERASLTTLRDERECPNCEGRGSVDAGDDDGLSCETESCPDCDGYRVQQRCARCGAWFSYESVTHGCAHE